MGPVWRLQIFVEAAPLCGQKPQQISCGPPGVCHWIALQPVVATSQNYPKLRLSQKFLGLQNTNLWYCTPHFFREFSGHPSLPFLKNATSDFWISSRGSADYQRPRCDLPGEFQAIWTLGLKLKPCESRFFLHLFAIWKIWKVRVPWSADAPALMPKLSNDEAGCTLVILQAQYQFPTNKWGYKPTKIWI